MRVHDDTWDGGEDEEYVANEGDGDRDTDGLETTPSCVGDVCAKQGNDIHPARDNHQPLIARYK